MKRKSMAVLAAAALLSGCNAASQSSEAPARPVSSIPVNPSTQPSAAGLQAVMGKDMAALTSMFGEPRLDVQETVGRKLQFSGRACVLDAYLYAEGSNGREVVTHVDARRSDGAEVDRAACIEALRRR